MTDPNIRTSFALVGTSDVENHVSLSAEQSRDVRSSTAVRDVLVAARKLIERPENWCQEAYSKKGGQFCAYGAVMKVYETKDDPSDQTYESVESILRAEMDGRYIEAWNDDDGRTHAEVLAAFDKAIAECGA